MDPQSQLKLLTPYLDGHLLLHLLSKNAAKETVDLQNQIRSKLMLSSTKEDSKTMEDAAKDKAVKLTTLLNNQALCDQMKKDKEFTFEKLREKQDIQIEDCNSLFEYGKILYELGKYPGKCC